MGKLTAQQTFDYGCDKYKECKKLILELTNLAQKINSEFSYEIAMRQFDMVLQAILLNSAVNDGYYLKVEGQFIEKIVDHGNLLNVVNRKLRESNSSWHDISWPDIADYSDDLRKKIALVGVAAVDEYAEDFVKSFALIDKYVNQRDYLKELKDLVIGIIVAFAAVDGDDLDSDDVNNESMKGIAAFNVLITQKWEKITKG